MDLESAIKVLLRRWLVVLIGLVLTVGVGAYLYINSPPSYQSTARMLLLLPSDARGADADGSPFLFIPSGLNVLARLVAVVPQSREFRADMIEKGFPSAYEVGVDPTTPIITVSVEGPDPVNVRETRDQLTAAIASELLRVQEDEGAPEKQTAHARVYAAESEPEQLSGSGLRGVLALTAVGALITLLAAFTVDRLSHLRRQRRIARASAAEPGDHQTAPGFTDEHTDAHDAAEGHGNPLTLEAHRKQAHPDSDVS